MQAGLPTAKPPISRPLFFLALIAPLALFIGFCWFDYRIETGRARDHVAATTDALAEHAEKVVETADLVLARILDHVAPMDWPEIGSSHEVHDFLAGLQRQLPQVESAFLVSPEGINAASSRNFPLPHISDASRDYFIRAVEGERGLFISTPFRGQIAGTYAFTVTRPRIKGDHFDGVAGVTISLNYFETFYRAVLENQGESSAGLYRDDGTLLVRVPQLARPIDRLPADGPIMRAAATGAAFGLISGSALEGNNRIGAFRRLQGRPLLVAYGIDRSVYLRVWYWNVALFALGALLLAAAILYVERTILQRVARERETMRMLVHETERRQRAEAALHQSQKMEALGQLTGGVAHDFNNLLTAILGSLELLQRHLPTGRPTRLLDTARQAAQRGAQLTAQMLAFSRRQDLSVQPVDVNATIEGMDGLLSRTVGASIRIKYDLGDGLSHAVADPVQLEVALLNLAANARDAMPAGGDLTFVTASITADAGTGAVPHPLDGEYVRISVIDTGEGMPEEVRKRALEPFFTTKGPGKGTGLGLSTVFGFTTLVGGAVTLESSPGKGTTVSLYLPRATRSAAEAPTAVPVPDLPALAQACILLVDDDQSVRATTRAMLEELQHTVTEAGSGPAALSILAASRRFDLLIIDFAMPEMNGSELIAKIRKTWPDAPILLVTGYVEPDSVPSLADLDLPKLTKPFTQSGLAAAAAEAIRRRGSSAEIIPLRAG